MFLCTVYDMLRLYNLPTKFDLPTRTLSKFRSGFSGYMNLNSRAFVFPFLSTGFVNDVGDRNIALINQI